MYLSDMQYYLVNVAIVLGTVALIALAGGL